jgi:hypothetical protein
MALTTHIEIFTLDHYRQSIDRDPAVSELWKDVFLFHMREESQHAIIDELEWQREDAKLTPADRDVAVGHLIELVGAVDGILQVQSARTPSTSPRTSRASSTAEAEQLHAGLLQAYRWQYIVSACRTRASCRRSRPWSRRPR